MEANRTREFILHYFLADSQVDSEDFESGPASRALGLVGYVESVEGTVDFVGIVDHLALFDSVLVGLLLLLYRYHHLLLCLL